MGTDVVHRLGMVLALVLGLAWAARWLERLRRERRVRRRLAGLLARETVAAGPRWRMRGVAGRWLPLVAVAGAGWAVVGGAAGVAVGLAGAAGLEYWRRRRPTGGPGTGNGLTAAESREAERQLPLAADLLAACIAAGAGPVAAAHAVGEALGGPVGEALARGAAEVRLGGEPADAWRRLATLPGAAALARLLERADVSGLPAAVPVARLAADARADWTRTATERARRAAVLVTAPVGLCFLPAFIVIGVLPVVIGLAGGLLEGGGGSG
ncbi:MULTISPECIES: type II secretion system F family protein [unclassified Streptomyces]|uniref:type II secretion system F family protein n=1 Tax=unclassified Streptomyces TaxID=2593676 RepID=UPI0036FC453E